MLSVDLDCPNGTHFIISHSPGCLQSHTVRLCLDLLLLALLVEEEHACCANTYRCVSPRGDDPLPLVTGACRCDAHESNSRPCMSRMAMHGRADADTKHLEA